MDKLSGSVERITFYNSENGYTVLRLRPEVRGRQRLPGLSAEPRRADHGCRQFTGSLSRGASETRGHLGYPPQTRQTIQGGNLRTGAALHDRRDGKLSWLRHGEGDWSQADGAYRGMLWGSDI